MRKQDAAPMTSVTGLPPLLVVRFTLRVCGRATIDHKVKETLHQIGAKILD
ncbi:MAG TPA: hypothetical protein VFI95_08105 [Terriglobales bacterium]|jgi:hypothetical protein|nr:hypothetical protein [Terriglobales bacterium]